MFGPAAFNPPCLRSSAEGLTDGGAFGPFVLNSVMPLPRLPATRLSWIVGLEPQVVTIPSRFGIAALAAALVPMVLSLIRTLLPSRRSIPTSVLPEIRLFRMIVELPVSKRMPNPRLPTALVPARLVPILLFRTFEPGLEQCPT